MPREAASITMPDGARLAASLYLPEVDGPWPVLLEALPYRKDDLTAHYAGEYEGLAREFGYAGFVLRPPPAGGGEPARGHRPPPGGRLPPPPRPGGGGRRR